MQHSKPTHVIETDGTTVWVNGTHGMLGRFGPRGIDVHIDGVCAGDGCVPGPTDIHSWGKFQITMLVAHGIKVSDDYMPNYLKEVPDGAPSTSRQNED